MTKKRILVIAPAVFGILNPLQEFLTSKGWEVKIIDDRFSCNFFTSLVLRYFRWLYFAVQRCSKLDFVEDDLSSYSHILIINGEGLSLKTHQRLIDARLNIVFYSWDSIKNKRYLKNVFDLYRSREVPIFTFDIEDSKRLFVPYQPLFAEELVWGDREKKYLISFVGTMHSGRLKHAILAEKFSRGGSNSFIQLFCKNRSIYLFQLMRNIFFLRSFFLFVKVGSMSKLDFDKIMTSSELVADFCHPNQSGLTHRSVLAMRNGIKVLSNNQYMPASTKITITNQSFYETGGSKDEQFSVERWANRILGDTAL